MRVSTIDSKLEPTRTLQVPATAWEAALIENHSMMRNALRVLGAGVLGLRDRLPADPNPPRVLDEGQYYAEPRSFVARLIELRPLWLQPSTSCNTNMHSRATPAYPLIIFSW